MSLIASVSPLIRWAIRVPREFVNDYIFNFPDTSFAWAFVLALLAAALAARKRIAWWILVLYMVAAVGWNVVDILAGSETVIVDIGEVIGAGFHVAAIGFLILARPEFYAKVRRGALIKAAATLVAGDGDRHAHRLGASRVVPRLTGQAGPASVRAEPGERLRRRRRRHLLRAPTRVRQRLARIVRRAGADGRRDRAVPVPTRRNALTGEDESAIRGLLELWGKNDSLGYFATRRDKSVVFAPNGRAAVTYRVEVGVCLASGDPLGDPRSWPPPSRRG